jgi:hypothetical protein
VATRALVLLIVAATSAAVLSGCFTTTADFREEAEQFIVEDPSIVDGLGVAITSATCDEPADQEVGTVFACTAIDANGEQWGFDVTIADSDSIELSVSERPEP